MLKNEIELIGYRLRSFGFKNLNEYYLSERWQEKKESFKRHCKHQCAVCAEDGKLDVHHKRYTRLCEELVEDLCYMCRYCHYQVHKLANKKGWSTWYASKKIRRGSRKKNAIEKSKVFNKEDKDKLVQKIRGDKHFKGLRCIGKAKDMNIGNDAPVKRYFVDPSTL